MKKEQWHEKMPLSAYWYVLLKANPKTFLEVFDMKEKTFEEIFTEAGIIPKWISQGKAEGEAKGKAEGKAEGKTEVARNLFSMGMPIEDIAKAVQMPVEELGFI